MIAILFAIAVLVVALFHEVQWRRRLTLWNKTDGTIVGEVEQEDYVHAEIEYFRNGQKAVFMSKYGGGRMPHRQEGGGRVQPNIGRGRAAKLVKQMVVYDCTNYLFGDILLGWLDDVVACAD